MIVTVAMLCITKENKMCGIRLIAFNKNVPQDFRLKVAGVLGNPQSDYIKVLNSCDHSTLTCMDYKSYDVPQLLQKWGISGLPCVDVHSNIFDGCKFTQFNSERLPVFLDYLKLYNNTTIIKPTIVKSITNYEVAFDTAPKSIRFLYVNRTPFCRFTPLEKPRSFSDLKFRLVGNILAYEDIKTVYILPQFSTRHKPVPVGEELTINLNNGLCIKKMARIANDEYANASYRYDVIQKQWVLVSIIERCAIDGFKRMK